MSQLLLYFNYTCYDSGNRYDNWKQNIHDNLNICFYCGCNCFSNGIVGVYDTNDTMETMQRNYSRNYAYNSNNNNYSIVKGSVIAIVFIGVIIANLIAVVMTIVY